MGSRRGGVPVVWRQERIESKVLPQLRDFFGGGVPVVARDDSAGTHGKEAPVRRKYRPFSEEEVAALIQGVRRHGQGNWTKIHDDVDLPFMVRP